ETSRSMAMVLTISACTALRMIGMPATRAAAIMNRSEMIRAVGPSREELISWCPAPKGFTPADSETIAATTMSRPEAIGSAQGPRSQRDTVLMGMPFGTREGAEGQDPGGGSRCEAPGVPGRVRAEAS